MTEVTNFEVTTRDNGGAVIVAVEGELDIATAPRLEAALIDVERNGTREIVLDLANVQFMDSSGLRSLLSARRRAESAGRALRLVNVPPDVRRVFDVTGVRRIFDIATSAS